MLPGGAIGLEDASVMVVVVSCLSVLIYIIYANLVPPPLVPCR